MKAGAGVLFFEDLKKVLGDTAGGSEVRVSVWAGTEIGWCTSGNWKSVIQDSDDSPNWQKLW